MNYALITADIDSSTFEIALNAMQPNQTFMKCIKVLKAAEERLLRMANCKCLMRHSNLTSTETIPIPVK